MFFGSRTADELTRKLREVEARISDLRCEEAVLVNELDKINIAARDGHRSLNEWLSAEMDVTRASASELVFAGRHLPRFRPINFRLADGAMSFDRAVATMRLAQAGADESTVTHSESLDLAAVRRLTARQRHITRRSEREAAGERFVSIQPTLDESAWRITGLLGSVDGRIFEQALYGRADELRLLAGGDQLSRAQLQADALVAMATDTGSHDGDASGGGSVSILVDLDEANGTGCETGCQIAYGPRVGPAVLEELLCTGTVRVIGLSGGRPGGVSSSV
jgi:hypothetical protein